MCNWCAIRYWSVWTDRDVTLQQIKKPSTNRGQAIGYYSLIKSYEYWCNRHARSTFYWVGLTILISKKAPWRRELHSEHIFYSLINSIYNAWKPISKLCLHDVIIVREFVNPGNQYSYNQLDSPQITCDTSISF